MIILRHDKLWLTKRKTTKLIDLDRLHIHVTLTLVEHQCFPSFHLHISHLCKRASNFQDKIISVSCWFYEIKMSWTFIPPYFLSTGLSITMIYRGFIILGWICISLFHCYHRVTDIHIWTQIITLDKVMKNWIGYSVHLHIKKKTVGIPEARVIGDALNGGRPYQW